ncbi:hypothetical protein [Sphingomonas bacterium]|uniref:hypothetical protein n=1 Tax=Sphingomonas bacterium TaxID=1895847 RepID=UPI00157777FC|nr:hypothetical protein [Sphingomonas bacterium]
MDTDIPRAVGKNYRLLYTDDRPALVDAIEGRDGAKVGAIDETLARGKAATIASPIDVDFSL